MIENVLCLAAVSSKANRNTSIILASKAEPWAENQDNSA